MHERVGRKAFSISSRAFAAAFGAGCLVLAASLQAAGGGGPVQVASADFPRPARPDMGVNLEGATDFAHSMMFADMIKSGRAFGSADKPWEGSAPLDANGWPTADAGMVVAADTPVPAGDYTFSCTGHCVLETVASNASVKTQAWHADTHTTTAVVTVNPDADALFLSFKNTDHGVQNIRLLRPGIALNSTELFSKEFLAALAPFSTLRLMDFTRTNTNDSKEWADRAKPTDALQTSSRGVAWEYAIQLANETHKDLWINIPALATDDYVRQLATLLKGSLNKDRAVYVEYSNEVWNGMFPQFHQNLDAAKAEVAAGNSPLDDQGNDKNQYYWAWKRVGKRLVEITNIFKAVYGPDVATGSAEGRPGRGPVIRPVLASQSASTFLARMQLEFIDKNYGPPSRIIYGLAGAPYLGIEGKISDRDDLTANEIFKTLLPDSMKTIRQWILDYQVLARYYRLHSLCYEGGQGIEGEHSSQAKLAANRDDRMGPVLHDYLTAWYSSGGELFMYFNLASSYTKWGSWGLTEDIRKSSPKMKAVTQLCAAPLPPITVGFSIPAVIPAEQFHGHDGGGKAETNADHTVDLAFLGKDNTFDYLLNVPIAGNYAVSLTTASTQADAAVEILFSGQSVGTLTSKNTGDWQKYAPTSALLVHLNAGQIVLRLKIANAGLNIRSIKVEKR